MKRLLSAFWKSTEKPQALPKRRIHLGIDYGTSASKIVFRDYGAPGGERGLMAMFGGSMRISSSIRLTSESLVFGRTTEPTRGSVLYESIKMRVAAEAIEGSTYYFGPATPLPDTFSACDLAVLTMWHLISEGHRAVYRHLSGRMGEVRLGMTMGVPMAFFDDPILRTQFLLIARRAWLLYRQEGLHEGAISIEKAHRVLERNPASAISETPEEQIRDWLRSEGEAAMWWPFQSPAVGPGPYAKIDIGAGTTHASLYRIYGNVRTPKTGIGFFGASTVAVGMDAVDQAIVQATGGDGDCLAIRGSEQAILSQNRAAQAAIVSVRERIYHAYQRAWIDTFQKIEGYRAERAAWDSHKIFMIGGGSLVPLLVDPMRTHPARSDLRVDLARLEPPLDLVGPTDGRSHLISCRSQRWPTDSQISGFQSRRH